MGRAISHQRSGDAVYEHGDGVVRPRSTPSLHCTTSRHRVAKTIWPGWLDETPVTGKQHIPEKIGARTFQVDDIENYCKHSPDRRL